MPTNSWTEAITISDLKSFILREVGMLARCIQSVSDIKFRETGLQRGQFIFLTRVVEHPGINLIELSDILKVDKTTTTKAIQKLIAEDYVRRERGPLDKREWRLYPTDRALAVYPGLIGEENRYIDTCFRGFSPEERDTVHRLCRRMRENIEQDWKTVKSCSDIVIAPYTDKYKEQIIDLILGIQADEFGIAITRADQPDLADIPGFYQIGAGNFWVALCGSRVVGTVALRDIGHGQAALRKFFVAPAFRGGGAARLLLAALLAWARESGVGEIYLGTTDRFHAAHRFYEKNGFHRVAPASLPPAFPIMKVDSIFFKYSLSGR